MYIRQVSIDGFRGVSKGVFDLTPNCVFVGPNGCGKSTLVDAIALTLGRGKLVRTLTEHDFTGSCPTEETRFRIVVTICGFDEESAATRSDWFREGRAVERYIDSAGAVHPEAAEGRLLCAQIVTVGRFDREDLEVETKRFFHDEDDEAGADPFLSNETHEEIPKQILNEAGFFVLLSRRTWEGAVSFNSELFRRTLLEAAGFPADEVLSQRDALRAPATPVEASPALGSLVNNMNERLGRLIPGAPHLKLRLTAGDSDSVLHALQPHYGSGAVSLPVARHGVGLLSLQSFLLLLEVAKARREKGRSVILALEEPELHLAPGLSARLVAEARTLADQVICTTHSPRVAGLFAAKDVFVVSAGTSGTAALPLLAKDLDGTATNVERKLFSQNRNRLIEAVMQPLIVVPEGRFDCEWLERFVRAAEVDQERAPFSSMFGLAPTEDAAVVRTVQAVHAVRSGVLALVDGDAAGDGYARDLRALSPAPKVIFQWAAGQTIEDVVGWVLMADEPATLASLQGEFGSFSFTTVGDFVQHLKQPNDRTNGIVGLKGDTVAHDAIIAIVQENAACRKRCAQVLDVLVAAATGLPHDNLEPPTATSTAFRLKLA